MFIQHSLYSTSMAVSLKVSPGMIGSVITATQAGYAIGLLFLVPLGDWLEP